MFLDMNTNRFNLLSEFRIEIQRDVNVASDRLDEFMAGA